MSSPLENCWYCPVCNTFNALEVEKCPTCKDHARMLRPQKWADKLEKIIKDGSARILVEEEK